jgi:uncharacterized protein
MRAGLQISRGLTLPLDYVTKTGAIIAKRRVGKTYTGAVFAEEMCAAGIPWYALDPTEAWWGLRADGQKPGLPVIVLGGAHGDIPITEHDGKAIADLVVDEPNFYVIDLSEVDESHSATVRFATAFLDRLYRRKAKSRDPLHGFWDEGDMFAPQKAGPSETTMLGAAESIVRRGGIRGLGTTLITQRAAVLNKNVLTQLDLLFMLRTISPQDQDAVDEYVKRNASPDERREIMGSLASLELGECWVYGPGEEPALLQRVRIRERRTFNSSATPKAGEKRLEPTKLADVDIDALRERLAVQIEKAKADDPAHLRKRIAALERELRERPAESVAQERVVRVPEVPENVLTALAEASKAVDRLTIHLNVGRSLAIEMNTRATEAQTRVLQAHAPKVAPRAPVPTPRRVPTESNGNGSLPATRQRIVDALAALEAVSITPASKSQLALFAKVSPKSSGYANNLGALRSAGLIDYPSGGMVALTEDGRAVADGSDVPTTQDELLAYVRRLIGPSKARVIDALVDVYPEALTRELLAERACVSAASSGYANNLGSLRSLGLLDYPQAGFVGATALLFP